MTVLPPAASGTSRRSTPPPGTQRVAGGRVSMRRLGNELMPTSDTPLTSTIIAAGFIVEKHTSPLASAWTISRLDATGEACGS